MTQTITGITVDLKAESAAFIREMGKASAATAAAANSMQQSARKIESTFVATGKAVTQFANAFKGLFAAQIILSAASAVTRYADAWQEATNKIAAASEISGKNADSMEALTKAAFETRSSIEDISDTYAKLLRTTAALPDAQGRVLQMTKTVTEAFRAGGASTLEAVNATRQLGQALGSGILQGDELRSVRENAPLIAKAIANEFNTTVAGLKALGAAGKLESDRVAKAIINAQKEIHDAFSQTKATFADVGTALGNMLTEFAGKANMATGTSQKLYDAVVFLTKAFEGLGNLPTPPSILILAKIFEIAQEAAKKAGEGIASLTPVETTIVAISNAAADSAPQLFAYANALEDVATQYQVLGQLSKSGDLASFFAAPINMANFAPGAGVPPKQLDQMMVDYKQHLKDVGAEEQRLAFLAESANNQLELRQRLAKSIQSPLEAYRAKLQEIAAAQVGVAETAELTRQAQFNLAEAYLDAVAQATGALASAFKDNKAFQIANAVVNTAAAVVKVLADPKIPFPLDIAVAAAMAAAGAAQIATIASTEMGNSSKTISRPSKTSATSIAGAASTAGGRSSPSQVVTINIEGDIFGPEHFRKIVAGINGVQKDGTALLRIA